MFPLFTYGVQQRKSSAANIMEPLYSLNVEVQLSTW
jgi:hypothetical protein